MCMCVLQRSGAVVVLRSLKPVCVVRKVPLIPYQPVYKIVFVQRSIFGREDAETRQCLDTRSQREEARKTVEEEGEGGPVRAVDFEKRKERISGAEMRAQAVQAGEEDECYVRVVLRSITSSRVGCRSMIALKVRNAKVITKLEGRCGVGAEVFESFCTSAMAVPDWEFLHQHLPTDFFTLTFCALFGVRENTSDTMCSIERHYTWSKQPATLSNRLGRDR